MNDPRPLKIVKPESDDARWRAYELAKSDWMRQHPYASAEQYQKAMREIAQRCGV